MGFNTFPNTSYEPLLRRSSVLAPLQGALGSGTCTGGLRCASTSGYFLASLRLAQRGATAGPERSRVKQRALVLAAIGLCLSVIAVREGKWAWWLTWLGLDFLVISVAYAIKASGVFGKRSDGTIPWWSYVVFFPYLVMSAAMWNLSRLVSRESAANAISKELVVGRRLAGGEPAPEFENCVDLTAEFQEAIHIRNTPGYVSFPVLDAGIPDPAALKRVISGLKPGRTFVHCAQGHGRTGMVALAILLTSKAVDSIDEGMRLLRTARPGIRLNRTQRQFIADFVVRQMGDGGGQ